MSLIKMKGITINQALNVLEAIGVGSLYITYRYLRIQIQAFSSSLAYLNINTQIKANRLKLHFYSLEKKTMVKDTLSNMVKDRLELRSLM